jgi:hypothetical protein
MRTGNALWAAVALCVLGCGGDGTAGQDAGRTDATASDAGTDGPSIADAAVDSAPKLAHFDKCSDASECPAGDSCSLPHMAIDPSGTKVCRPPCTSDHEPPAPECMSTTNIVTDEYTCTEGFCWGVCVPGNRLYAECKAPFHCRLYPGYATGYCTKY